MRAGCENPATHFCSVIRAPRTDAHCVWVLSRSASSSQAATPKLPEHGQRSVIQRSILRQYSEDAFPPKGAPAVSADGGEMPAASREGQSCDYRLNLYLEVAVANPRPLCLTELNRRYWW